MYWSDLNNHTIYRANLNGTDVEVLTSRNIYVVGKCVYTTIILGKECVICWILIPRGHCRGLGVQQAVLGR